MRVVIAPDSFKESHSASEVCAAIARGIRRLRPDAFIDAIPMADGGEGTVDALVSATGGTFHRTTVSGPLGEPVNATWGLLGDGSNAAVLEMAAASGLPLVPPDRRNPMLTTTLGTGELIRAALDAGAERILIGIGGSATTDGGAGAAQAVGVRFLDGSGQTLPLGLSGGRLGDIGRIDMTARDPRLGPCGTGECGTGVSPVNSSSCGTGFQPVSPPNAAGPAKTPVHILVACDVDNPLRGPRGAAAIYGPQKGATPEQVTILDRNLAHLAELIERDLGKAVRDIPGAGAAGGLGAGLIAFFDAKLDRGIRLVMDAVHFADRIRGADLIITGEGRLDRQSMMGKVIAGVGQAGKAAGIPVVALVGAIGEGAEAALDVLESYHPINPPDMPLAEAIARTDRALERAAVDLIEGFYS